MFDLIGTVAWYNHGNKNIGILSTKISLNRARY